jgi:hypothetical protein
MHNEPRSLPLRDRLEWLLLAIASHRYGETVDTRNVEFEADYIVATRGPVVRRLGRVRSRQIASDLKELFERGLLARKSASAGHSAGGASFYFSYSSAPAGEAEVNAIKARQASLSFIVSSTLSN